jgi:hypothetical protein
MNKFFTFFRQRSFRLFPYRQTSPASVLTGQVPQNVPTDPTDPLPGRDLMFTLIHEYLTMQHQAADQLDTKAAGILVGGTTLVGFAFLVQHHPVGNCSVLIPTWVHHWPIMLRLGIPYLPFLLCYTLAIIFALQASRIRGYWTVPDPVKALKCMKETERGLKLSLSQSMAHFSKVNEMILDTKASLIKWAVRLLLAETIALVLLLFYQTIC